MWIVNLYNAGEYALLLSWAFWVLLSITLHELAHGWAAIWQGDDTPIRYNRMTLNPVVHMGWMSIIIFALFGIAWGLMPVDPSRFRWGRRGRIVVAGAGPAMNVLLAFIALTAAALWLAYGPTANAKLHDNVMIFLTTGGWLNLALALFNLLPIPPLDGASILAGMSLTFYRWMHNPNFQQIGFFIFLAIFMSGIGGLMFSGAQSIGGAYVGFILGLLGGGMRSSP